MSSNLTLSAHIKIRGMSLVFLYVRIEIRLWGRILPFGKRQVRFEADPSATGPSEGGRLRRKRFPIRLCRWKALGEKESHATLPLFSPKIYTRGMRLLGIDYGSKRIGLALSDDKGLMAFPHSVVPNDKNILVAIGEIVRRSDVRVIVVGDSKDYKGEPNKIMLHVNPFVVELRKLGYKVMFELELLTSHQAAHFQGKTAMTDASAASIILQSYIDRNKDKIETGELN